MHKHKSHRTYHQTWKVKWGLLSSNFRAPLPILIDDQYYATRAQTGVSTRHQHVHIVVVSRTRVFRHRHDLVCNSENRDLVVDIIRHSPRISNLLRPFWQVFRQSPTDKPRKRCRGQPMPMLQPCHQSVRMSRARSGSIQQRFFHPPNNYRYVVLGAFMGPIYSGFLLFQVITTPSGECFGIAYFVT